MTVVAIFAQIPVPSSFSVLKDKGIFPRKTRCPRIAIRAGSTMTEKIIATETASVPPIPRLGNPVFSKNNIPIRPIATVIPLKNTAFPAVATVMAVDVRMSRPRFSSSRNRLTKNNE